MLYINFVLFVFRARPKSAAFFSSLSPLFKRPSYALAIDRFRAVIIRDEVYLCVLFSYVSGNNFTFF